MAASREKFSKRRIFKIIVIGDSNVGKTCLAFRFCSGMFWKQQPTCGVDFYHRDLNVNGEAITLLFVDTAAMETFKSMRQQYYRSVHAVVFVYDVRNRSSFDNLSYWIEECNRNHVGPDIPRIIIGNKCDGSDEIKVGTKVAKRFADDNQMPLFETSAKDNSFVKHVEFIFLEIAHKLQSCPVMMTSITPLSPSDPTLSFSPSKAASNEPITLTVNSNASTRQSSSSSSCC